MAIYPCTVHGARFRGPANHWYGFVSREDSTTRSHLRLCNADSEALGEIVQQEMAEISQDETVAYPEVTHCFGCKLPIEDRYAIVIITGFNKGDDKRQWMSGLHHACGLPGWLRDVHERGMQSVA